MRETFPRRFHALDDAAEVAERARAYAAKGFGSVDRFLLGKDLAPGLEAEARKLALRRLRGAAA